jgi:UTP-glucose-1-phosphate uridylyltransferase
MAKPTLVIMAAGMGSRYGGLKQIDPIGPNGEIIMDYSVYDALMAGFGRLVVVLRKEIEQEFRASVGKRLEKKIQTAYSFQCKELPAGFVTHPQRTKPWGTGQAVLCVRDLVDGPFAVINADDFYGRDAFMKMGAFLKTVNPDKHEYGMVGYILDNTLTDNGYVSRAICSVENGMLRGVTERKRIQRFGDKVIYVADDENPIELDPGSVTSMNFWGFTPRVFQELDKRFIDFLNTNNDPLKGEYLLPEVIDKLIKEQIATVRVLRTDARWYGVTYVQDRNSVQNAVKSFIEKGEYPQKIV